MGPEGQGPGPDKEPQFHPAVEELMVTSGPDKGRVKNEEVARDAADAQNRAIESGADDLLSSAHASESIDAAVRDEAMDQQKDKISPTYSYNHAKRIGREDGKRASSSLYKLNKEARDANAKRAEEASQDQPG